MKKIFFLILLLCCFAAHGSVVLIHGFLLSPHHMCYMQKTLRCCFDDIYYFEYDSRKDYIHNHGVKLSHFLSDIACRHPGEPIHFVTHSIGALVLRSALNNGYAPEEANIGRAVLLAPPNRGSMLARKSSSMQFVRFVMGDKSGKELMTLCPEEYACFGEFPSCMQVLVIAGDRGIHPFFEGLPNDNFLTVEETRLNTPHCHQILPLTHAELLKCSSSLHLTRNFLLCGN